MGNPVIDESAEMGDGKSVKERGKWDGVNSATRR